MPRYSEGRRQAAVAKLLPPHNLSPKEVSEQEGISMGTVYTWRRQARAEGRCLPDALGRGADGWSSRDKFTAVVETASMNAQEVAEHCRRRGLYPEQLDRWRHDCEQAASLSHDERQREADEERDLASPSLIYRVLHKHHEAVHRGRAKPPKRAAKPTTYQAIAPNQVWSWDCSWMGGPIKGEYYYLVMMLDIFSRKITGCEVFLAESAHNSRSVMERAVLAERVINQPLVLHADNGSPFKGATLLEKMHDLGITPSFSRPRVSNDNPYSEALFRTCKYRPCYPVDGFASLEAARQWVAGFVRWYNHEHRHSGIRLVTPAQRHAGEDVDVLAKRHAINQAAREANPARWSGKTRNWAPLGTVSLNPERELQITTAEPENQVA